ncbi:hypothetical protein CH300_20120 [Rhodococcus sp. 15-1154-1]|nr:hypothetical protein [Rhodococcus sp. 15-1154-1]OZF00847.1 hypothetical protein CH300_20120 [Rhodococcus sp. 15-1154-1]
MSWTVYSVIDQSRWMNFVALDDWVSDQRTFFDIAGAGTVVRLSPLGPFQENSTESEEKLFYAAMAVIPGARSVGATPPPRPAVPIPDGAVS